MSTSNTENTMIQQEIAARMRRTSKLMDAHDLQAILVYADGIRHGNIRYMTDYSPIFGGTLLMLSRNQRHRLIITYSWDLERAEKASGLDVVDTLDFVTEATNWLGQGGARANRVGVVGYDIIPYPLLHGLIKGNANCQFLDITADYEALRLRKSRYEIEQLREATKISDKGMEAAARSIRAGRTEIQVAADIDYAMREAGAEGFIVPTVVAAGPNSETPTSLASRRVMKEGETVIVDQGAIFNGYRTDISRSFIIGSPTAEQQAVYDVVLTMLDNVIGSIRPGVVARRLHEIAVETAAEVGLSKYFPVRVGHGIGLETSTERPNLQTEELQLEPGMTFVVEPGLYIPELCGYRVEEAVLVTESGCEVLSKSPIDLVAVGF